MLDGRVLRGKTERVPPHGMQHVVPLKSTKTGHDIANGIVAHMPHVDIAGRIRKHFQDIILGTRGIRFANKRPALGPQFLPLFFNALMVVAGGNGHMFQSFKQNALAHNARQARR